MLYIYHHLCAVFTNPGPDLGQENWAPTYWSPPTHKLRVTTNLPFALFMTYSTWQTAHLSATYWIFFFFVLGEHWCITKYIELYVSEWCLKTSEEATIEGLLHTNLAQGPSLPYIRPCMDQLENISYSIIYHFHNQQSFPSLLLGCNTSRTLMQFHFLHVLKQKLCSISHSYIICISLYILRNCIVVFFKESVCNGFRIKEVGYLFCCSTYVRLVNSVLQFSGSSLVY